MRPSRILQLKAIYSVQGSRVVARKILDYLRGSIGRSLENDIVPYLRMESTRGYRTYIDIGAARGDTILPIVRQFDLVLALEADPRNIKPLQNATRNLRNVRILSEAVSDASGEVDLYIADRIDQSSLAKRATRDAPSVKVHATSLDLVLEEFRFQFPCLIKIDVQGYEFNVMRGAGSVLKRRCTIFTEFWPFGIKCAGADPLDYLAFMEGKGFAAYNLSGRRLTSDKLRKFCKIAEADETNQVSTDLVFRRE